MQKIQIIDSHTAGEPTRVVIEGGPDLGDGILSERLKIFRTQHDNFRSAVVNEPRGSDVIVGALLCQPVDPGCVAGVIYFNNVGYLGMCGHGTIGVITTLAYLKRIGPGQHRLETPVGVVTTVLEPDGSVTVQNLPAYRHAAQLSVEVEGHGKIHGDVAWGGNWFFLTEDHGQSLEFGRVEQLTEYSWRVRQSLEKAGVRGANGAIIDHIELFGEAGKGANSRSFVLCPGKAYDRSPCGTGTSAKLACLAANGKLAPGQSWVQESIIGSRFEASYSLEGDHILPRIRGQAFITLEGQLLLDPADPFKGGIAYAVE